MSPSPEKQAPRSDPFVVFRQTSGGSIAIRVSKVISVRSGELPQEVYDTMFASVIPGNKIKSKKKTTARRQTCVVDVGEDAYEIDEAFEDVMMKIAAAEGQTDA